MTHSKEPETNGAPAPAPADAATGRAPKAADVSPDVSGPAPEDVPAAPRRDGGRLAALRRAPAVLLLVLLAFFAGRACGPEASSSEPSGGASDHDHAGGGEGEAATIYTCSMHPQIRMSEPGNCPICGMELIPVQGSSDEEEDGPFVVRLSPRARALAAVQTTAVRREAVQAQLRLLGRVEVDETRLRTITPWIGGRIDRLRVKETGVRVRAGQVVADLYSPQVYAALRDLSVALETGRRLAEAGGGAGTDATVAAAREKLRLLGVDASVIDAVEAGGKVPEHVPVRSRVTGTVLRRLVEQGDYVTEATPMYEVADLSVVWVQLEAYEEDLPRVRMGAEVYFEPEGVDVTYTGKVVFVDPVVDPRRRIARVRVEVRNPGRRLRPGMFGTAVVVEQKTAGGRLVVPASAVLFTGRRSVVYVERAGEPGVYELRVVRPGAKIGDEYVVEAGLSEGERVVTKGAFFLDADLQLRGGRSMMTLPDDRTWDDAPPLVVTDATRSALAPLMRAYLAVAAALAADDFERARAATERLATALAETDLPGPPATRQAFAELATQIGGHLGMARKAGDLAGVRRAFEMLAAPMTELLSRFGNPTDQPLVLVRCPMAFDAKGARWIQPDEPVANPYFGAKMPACGNIEARIVPGERLVRLEPPPAEAPPAAPTHHH